MAYANAHIADFSHAPLQSIANGLRHWRAQRAEFNRVFAELSTMDDRELADIGIARASIGAIAREAAALV